MQAQLQEHLPCVASCAATAQTRAALRCAQASHFRPPIHAAHTCVEVRHAAVLGQQGVEQEARKGGFADLLGATHHNHRRLPRAHCALRCRGCCKRVLHLACCLVP